VSLPGRNDPCPCGAGVKFKKCCLRTVEQLLPHGVKSSRFHVYGAVQKLALEAAKAAKGSGYNEQK
jgi:hypothetical protein